MRIRATKPEFWKSKRIASVSWEDRLLLKGLESYVDDNGVGVDDVELIVTDVFPRDMFASPRETVARVSEGISRLQQAGLVHRYCTDSDNLLYIAFWEEVQRIDKPGKGRYPRPDGTMNYRDSIIRESVASPRETVAPGTGEQGNRGTEVNPLFNDADASLERDHEPDAEPELEPVGYPDNFEQFWTTYPRRQKKGDALRAFLKARKRASLEQIVAGAARLRDDPNREDQFTPLAATWLNADGWEDEPLPPRTSGKTFDQQRRDNNNRVLGKYLGGGDDPWNTPRPARPQLNSSTSQPPTTDANTTSSPSQLGLAVSAGITNLNARTGTRG